MQHWKHRLPPATGGTSEAVEVWQKKRPEASGFGITSSAAFIVIHFSRRYLVYFIQSVYHEELWINHVLVGPSTREVSEPVINDTMNYVDNCLGWLRHRFKLPCLNGNHRKQKSRCPVSVHRRIAGCSSIMLQPNLLMSLLNRTHPRFIGRSAEQPTQSPSLGFRSNVWRSIGAL